MKIEELLARADTVLSSLMPPGSMGIVTAIDPELVYPKNLTKVLLKLRPVDVLLDNAETRNILLLMLPQTEAKALALELNWNRNIDVFEFLQSTNFNRALAREILFRFFGVEIPVVDTKELTPATLDVSPAYSLFEHQAKALRKVERLLEVEPRRALLHMPTGSGKTRTAMNLVSNYF